MLQFTIFTQNDIKPIIFYSKQYKTKQFFIKLVQN
jgi:hypothetical protein